MYAVLQRSVGTWGLTGLDRLLCFMIVQELQNTLVYLMRGVFQDKAMLDVLSKFNKEMQPLQGLIGESRGLSVTCTLYVTTLQASFIFSTPT